MRPAVGHLAMTAILAIGFFVVAEAFNLMPQQSVGIRSCTSQSYHRFPKTICIHSEISDNILRKEPSFRPSSLFAVSSVDPNSESGKKRNRVLRLFQRGLSSLRFFRASKRLRSCVASMVLIFAMTFSVMNPAWAAGRNGRMGGSFGRASQFRSPPISRMSHRPAVRSYQRNQPAPIRVIHNPAGNRAYRTRTFHPADGGEAVAVVTAPDGTMSTVRKVNPHPFSDGRASVATIAFTSSAVVAYGVQKRQSDRDKYEDDDLNHPLGPGLSVWSLTASLNVPDVNAPTSIVRKIQKIADATSTKTREGLQSLIAETSLELSRQLDKGTLSSVESRYDHYHSSDQAVVRAERQYNTISARERSKFDQESWSSYNGKIVRDDDVGDDSGSVSRDSSASIALVQIHLVLEGNSMEGFGARQVETRKSLRNALVQLSGDVSAVKDCVVAGEVLWTPQLNNGEQEGWITEEDLYANYPRLWPVDYSK